MSLGEKLVKVMAACQYMPKDSTNTYQNYKYTSAAGMFGKINEALVKEKLYTSCELELLEMRDVQNQKGNVEKYATVRATITIHDSESDGQTTFSGLGSGQDVGDKAVMKANTAALKYAYIGGLCIAMADDPEADETPTQPTSTQNVTYKEPQVTSGFHTSKYTLVGDCEECGRSVTQKVIDYSKKKFGRVLCMNCQKKAQVDDEVPFT